MNIHLPKTKYMPIFGLDAGTIITQQTTISVVSSNAAVWKPHSIDPALDLCVSLHNSLLVLWKIPVNSSPFKKTVVLGVTSRSRDELKGKAHSLDSLERSRRGSRSRRSRTEVCSPMLNLQN